MNVWKLTAAKTVAAFEEEPRQIAGALRVRVTKVFLSAADGLLFRGIPKVKYPIVPGRYAVGIVADEGGSALFRKGTRVLLHSYLPAEDGGTERRSFTEDEYLVCGQTADGYLRDFVYVREDRMTPLPDSVNDEKALLIQHVALAQAAIDTLGARQGEHIAVIGGNILGLFLCRLLIYRQAAPILIDRRKSRLDFARSRGVYYSSLPDETLMDMVGTVTGGRLADGVVYVTSAGENDISLPARVVSAGKHMVYCGSVENLSLDLADVIKKELTVHGVPDGTDWLETAINLVANKAVDLSGFRFTTYDAGGIPALLEELSEDDDRPADEICVVNMV